MGRAAARLGDMTQHGPPVLGKPALRTFIQTQPAWRIGDVHACPLVNPPPACTPHVGGPTTPAGPRRVFVEAQLAAREGDLIQEASAVAPPSPNRITKGASKVRIG